jgi:hypothetical protein
MIFHKVSSRRIKWARHAACLEEMSNAYIFLLHRPPVLWPSMIDSEIMNLTDSLKDFFDCVSARRKAAIYTG